MATLNANIVTAPGVYVSENTAGYYPTEFATFNRCYALVSSTSGAFNSPIQVISAADATNIFGTISTVSLNAIELFFANHPAGILFLTRVPYEQAFTVTVSSAGDASPATVFTVTATINGTVCTGTTTYAETALDTTAEIAAALSTSLSTDIAAKLGGTTLVNTAYTSGNTFTVAIQPGQAANVTTLTVTASDVGDGAISVSAGNPPTPTASNYAAVLNATTGAFDPDEHKQGFLICPEAFANLSSQSDRTTVATAMENLASSEGFDWMALVDCGAPAQIATVGAANTEGQLYTTSFGHLAYYYPWVQNLDDEYVPPSAAVAAIGLKKFAIQGFNQPPASASEFPIKGVKNVQMRVTKNQQAVSNPLGVNIIRFIPGSGIYVYGARTRSTNAYYRFINTRIIFNVLIGTLRRSFDWALFAAIDGQGVLFQRIKQTAEGVCYRIWVGGGLFGATPRQAFLVICDRSNNPDFDLEAGIVRVDIFAAPSPTAERILVGVFRVPIGAVPDSAIAVGV